MAAKTNKAVVITRFNLSDPISTLKIIEKPMPVVDPVSTPGYVLVQVVMRPINPSDVFALEGMYPSFRPKLFPAVPGFEGCGVIADGNKTGLQKGQRVICFFDNSGSGDGSWQEFVVLKASSCIPISDKISDESACQFMVNPLSVIAMLKELNIPKGSYLVQSAAGSVLGRQMITIAKLQGVKTINIVRRQEQVKELLDLGGDVVLCSESLGLSLGKAIRKAADGKGAYAGIDCVGGALTTSLMQGIRVNGTLLVYGAMSGPIFEGSLADAMFRNITVKGFWLTSWMPMQDKKYLQSVFKRVIELMETGILEPLSGTKYSLDEIIDAYRNSIKENRGGKILLVSKL